MASSLLLRARLLVSFVKDLFEFRIVLKHPCIKMRGERNTVLLKDRGGGAD
ncbi:MULTISPECIES: hypothetical protein [unclassified Iodobacter]|uniref:hypothetical protein n=1 Tax=unclassified Iodobacter TaxID=235634 RepID=UPI0027BAC7F4|nr:hypothetical protein [Iodobacter sp. BJB302]